MAERGPWGDPARLKRIKRHGRLNPNPGPCTGCGNMMDGWTALEPGTRPTAGDSFAVCWYCATVHEYVSEPLRLRRLEGDELILALAASSELRRARTAIIIKRATEPEADDGSTPKS